MDSVSLGTWEEGSEKPDQHVEGCIFWGGDKAAACMEF